MAMHRGVKVVFVFLLVAVMVSMGGMVAMYFFVSGSAPSVSTNSVLVLPVPGGLSEREGNPLLTAFAGPGATLASVVESLRKAKVDQRIRGVILAPAGPQVYWGKAQEIRDAIVDYRESDGMYRIVFDDIKDAEDANYWYKRGVDWYKRGEDFEVL